MLSRLIVYPIKGCQGVERKVARLDPDGGLEFDRWFCIVDDQGSRFPAREFLNQRKFPELATIQVRLSGDSMIVSAKGNDEVLEVPLQEGAYENNADIKVECGGTSTTASGGWSLGYIDGKSCGETAAQWFTKYFARFPSTRVSEDSAPTRFELVRCLRSHARPLDSFAGPTQLPFSADINDQRAGVASPFKQRRIHVTAADRARFQDCMPLLVVSENSFMELQRAMDVEHFPLENFRPNVVVSGFRPWEEWKWSLLKIGSQKNGGATTLRLLKPCPRCTVPARNNKTGEWQLAGTGKPKLLAQRTLGKMFPQHLKDDEWGDQWQGPCFGVHAAHDGTSRELRVGARVEATAGFHNKVLQSLMEAFIWALDFWPAIIIFWGLMFLVYFPPIFRNSLAERGMAD
eukprot:INCI6729.1.p1 GENE.INCI6729.1~~INCI6729.1.p1  ORF type:complete len:403 (+),score=55.98 INCI6729.1:279-1487(+)